MNSMETCTSLRFFFFFLAKYGPDHIWQNPVPANIRKRVFHGIKRDGITSFHGIHESLLLTILRNVM